MNLLSLPPEIIANVLATIPAAAVGRFRTACKHCNKLGTSDSIWQSKFTATREWTRCGSRAVQKASTLEHIISMHHFCAACMEANNSPVGFPAPWLSRVIELRTKCEQAWCLSPSQLAAIDPNAQRPDWELLYCALWPTHHGPRLWVHEATNHACAADLTAGARNCILGWNDAAGWTAVPAATEADQPTAERPVADRWPSLSVMALSGSEWRRLESWLTSPDGAGAAVAHSLPPPAVKLQVSRTATALALDVRRSFIALSRILPSADCALVFTMGVFPTAAPLTPQAFPPPPRPSTHMHRQLLRVSPHGPRFRHPLGEVTPPPLGSTVVECVAVHLPTGRQFVIDRDSDL